MSTLCRYALFLLAGCCLSLPLRAQPDSGKSSEVFEISGQEQEWTSPVTAIPLEQIDPFLSFYIVWKGGRGDHFEVRFSADGVRWSTWKKLTRNAHHPDGQVTELHFADATSRFFQVRCREMTASNLTCHFYSPGATPVLERPEPPRVSRRTEECPQPTVVARSDWCPNFRCPENPNAPDTEVSHLIVHHSAGTNVSSDWAAVVRAIWDSHVRGNGWSDIGYNYLVDPNGVIYEGRGNDVLGAHFCGTNSNTMGVCILGNFQEQAPAQEALASLAGLLSWKSADRSLDPAGSSFHASSGRNLYTISGHRDGCATACPGDMLYPLLPELRLQVRDSLDLCQGGLTNLDDSPMGSLTASARIFPNPAGEQLQVELNTPESGMLAIEIFSIDGRRRAVFRQEKEEGISSLSVPLSSIPPGYYRLRLQLNGHYGVKSFVKQ